MKKQFEIVKYNPRWAEMFLVEKKKLKKIFEDNLISIHHIGSTAIPITRAKPEIDILIVVKTDSNIAKYNREIERLGYDIRGECLENGGTSGRHYYSKDINNRRTHKLHICQIGHEEILSKLIFVRYMKNHKHEAKKYSRLKIDLSKEYNYGRNFEKYLAGKTTFILSILDKAFKENKDISFQDFI